MVQAVTGEFEMSTGSKGTDLGQFNGLRGLSLTPDEVHLLVCDQKNHRVVVADARDGRSLQSLQGPAGTLSGPVQAIMVPQTSQVLVVDVDLCRVVVFSGLQDQTVVRTLGEGQGHDLQQLFFPCGLAVLDGEGDGPVVAVADTGNHRLVLWRVRDGTVVRPMGSEGTAPGQFNLPKAVTVVPARSTGTDEEWLVVADSSNHRVQVLTRTGTVVRVLQGDAVIKLGSDLPGVTVCIGTGEVLVTDCNNRRVVSWRLSDGGGLRVVCCGVGAQYREAGVQNAMLLYYPLGVVASIDGLLWVADRGLLKLFR